MILIIISSTENKIEVNIDALSGVIDFLSKNNIGYEYKNIGRPDLYHMTIDEKLWNLFLMIKPKTWTYLWSK